MKSYIISFLCAPTMVGQIIFPNVFTPYLNITCRNIGRIKINF